MVGMVMLIILRIAMATRVLRQEEFQCAVMQTFKMDASELGGNGNRMPTCMVLVHGSDFGIGTNFNRAMEENAFAVPAHLERKTLAPAQQPQQVNHHTVLIS